MPKQPEYSLSIREAMDALQKGQKIAGVCWGPGEYIQYDALNGVRDEEGNEVNASTLLVNTDWTVVR